MLYIISFQSISCPPGLRGGLQLGLRRGPSPRPHAAPPEGSSVRLKGRGFGRAAGHFDRAPQYKVLYRPATQSSDRASPRSFPQSSTPVFHTCSARSSGRFSRGILWAIPRNNSLWVRIPVLRPVFPSVIPSIFHPVSHTLLSSALWPVPQNNSQASPRGGLRHAHPAHRYLRAISAWQSRHLSSLRHGHPVHRYLSAIPTCRTITQSLSNLPLTGTRPIFATATLPTSTSGAFPRGKAVIYHPFATATLPTGTPVPSPRAEQSNNLSQTVL